MNVKFKQNPFMNQNDDKDIRDLFASFDPDLPSDFMFMNRLRHSLDSVEMIKKHNEEFKARSRKAVFIAGVTGFVVGVIFSMFIPMIGRMISELRPRLSGNFMGDLLLDNYLTIVWMVICGAAVLISMNAYDLSLFLMKDKDKKER